MYQVLAKVHMRKLKTILQHRYLFKIIAFISLIYMIIMTNFISYQSKYQKDTTIIEGTIYDYQISDNKISLTISAKEKIVGTYYFKNEQEQEYYQKNLSLGDTFVIEGTLNIPYQNTIPNTFNYRKYLYQKHIYYQIKIQKLTKIKDNTSIINHLRTNINNYLTTIDNTGYLKTFILGNKDTLDEEVMTSYQDNGLSHLFSISGMHINLLATLILYLLKKISYNNFYNYSIVLAFILFYAIIINFGTSVIRTIVMFTLFTINKLFNIKIKSIDLMLLTLSIIIIFDPFIFHDIGFQFSYITSFTLILLSKKINNYHNYFIKSLYTSFICTLVSLPICLANFYQVSIISIILNIIFIPLVSYIIFPLCIMSLILPFLLPILNLFTTFLEKISLIANDIPYTKLILPKPSFILIVFYYFAIYLALYRTKYLLLFLILIISHKISIYLDPSMNIIFFDVGQGDSVLISYPYNQLNILIDTGGLTNNTENYSITQNKTIPYLKSQGITQIDYLILSHGDYDHIGEGLNLVNNFKIKNVIFNNDSYNNIEKELIKALQEKKIKYYQNIKELNTKSNKLYFLNNKLYDNENNNSNVIYFNYNNIKMLFMGDAGIEVEEDILEEYNIDNIDILKVGHHGSKTSSSQNFIDNINPRYSIISVGKNNRYGHPNAEVLNNLDNSIIYRTDIDGSIIFKIKSNNLKIETCAP